MLYYNRDMRNGLILFLLLFLIQISGISAQTASTPGNSAFWNSLKQHCGKAFAGEVKIAPEGDSFRGKKLVMHVRSCEENVIKIPFFVGEDRSRTWVLTKVAGRIELKHDHRHEDGKPDDITMYGGMTTSSGSAEMQVFPADEETAKMLPAAISNVWWVDLTKENFTYNLRRVGTDRFYSIQFDLTKEIAIPEAPWGWGDSVSNAKKIPITSKSKEAIQFYKTGVNFDDRLEKDKAEIGYQEALKLDPGFAMAYLRLAMLRDDFDARENYLKEAMKHIDKVSDGEGLWIEAKNAFYVTRKPAEEYAAFEKLIKLYPEDEHANYLFGYINHHHAGNDLQKAIFHLEKAIKINPEFILPYEDLAYAYMEARDFENSEKVIQAYIKLLPESANPYDTYAEMLMRDSQFERSIEMYDKVLSIDPKYAFAIMGKSANLNFLERHAEARKILPELNNMKLSDYEDRHRWRSMMGSFVDEGKFDEAIAVLNEQNKYATARKDFHQIFFSHLRATLLYFEKGDAKGGLKEYKRWSKSQIANDAVKERIAKLENYYNAYAAFLEGKFDSAKSLLGKFNEVNGSANDDSKILMARILVKEKKLGEALDTVMTTDLENAYNQYQLAEIYELISENNLAKKWYRKASLHNTRNDLDFALVRRKAKAKLK